MYRLPEELRPVLQQPMGPVLSTEELLAGLPADGTIVCVGDIVSNTMLGHDVKPKLIVVDFRTKRGEWDPDLQRLLSDYGDVVLRVTNPAGFVTDELIAAVRGALKVAGSVRIEVDGEEDLAGLPAMAHAEDGTIVLYGMPNRGVVRVDVTPELRAKVQELFGRMTRD